MVEISAAVKEAYEYASGDVTFWDTLEINHQSFLVPIRVVRAYRALQTNQGEFLPCHFDFALPSTEPGVRGSMTVTIKGVPKEARIKIREAAATRNKVEIIYRQYIVENGDPDVELPVPLQVTNIKETPTGLEASAMFPDLINMRFPQRVMTVEDLPGGRT